MVLIDSLQVPHSCGEFDKDDELQTIAWKERERVGGKHPSAI
jgi:hypothetical protein